MPRGVVPADRGSLAARLTTPAHNVLISLSWRDRHAAPMDGAQESLGAQMLELARRCEGMSPVDVPGAQEHLSELRLAMDQVERWDAALGFARADDSGARLRSLVARISDDVASGHVVAVRGLERQVRCYLQRRAASERVPLR